MSDAKTKARVYKGEKISVSYDLKLCMHAAECVTSGLSNVFNKNQRPWVNPDGSSPEKIIGVIERCPSAALKYELQNNEEMSETNAVRPQPNSALYVRGDIRLQDHEGTPIAKESRLALCRCGQSKNKPFCDYSHHDAGFEDDGELASSNLTPEIMNTEDTLTITASQNGPLLLQGAFALRSADNTQINYGEKAALCRCGQSSNKPFCDGTHKEIDFKTD